MTKNKGNISSLLGFIDEKVEEYLSKFSYGFFIRDFVVNNKKLLIIKINHRDNMTLCLSAKYNDYSQQLKQNNTVKIKEENYEVDATDIKFYKKDTSNDKGKFSPTDKTPRIGFIVIYY